MPIGRLLLIRLLLVLPIGGLLLTIPSWRILLIRLLRVPILRLLRMQLLAVTGCWIGRIRLLGVAIGRLLIRALAISIRRLLRIWILVAGVRILRPWLRIAVCLSGTRILGLLIWIITIIRLT